MGVTLRALLNWWIWWMSCNSVNGKYFRTFDFVFNLYHCLIALMLYTLLRFVYEERIVNMVFKIVIMLIHRC